MKESNIGRLVAHEFATRKVLRLLREEDAVAIGIEPLGQRRVLLALVASLTSPPQPPPPTISPAHRPSSSPQAPTGLEDSLQRLFRSLPSHGQPPSVQPINTAGEIGVINPLYHLLPPGAAKYHQITKFVNGIEEEVVEELWTNGDRKVFMSGSRRPKLQQVSPMQWCGANVRILLELLRERSLQPENIVDYLAYTAKISDLAMVYKWASVLQFDDQYRKAQAENGFRWGSESPHVDRICLRFKEEKKDNPPDPNKKTRICINYQYGKCHRGNTCMFRHVCSAPGCTERHGLQDHKQTLNG